MRKWCTRRRPLFCDVDAIRERTNSRVLNACTTYLLKSPPSFILTKNWCTSGCFVFTSSSLTRIPSSWYVLASSKNPICVHRKTPLFFFPASSSRSRFNACADALSWPFRVSRNVKGNGFRNVWSTDWNVLSPS